MSKIKIIREAPTIFDNTHESIYRAAQVLDYVKELLQQDVATCVILEIIAACYEEHLPQTRYGYFSSVAVVVEKELP